MAAGEPGWLTTFRGINPQVWSGALPEDPYVINFHKGEVREVDLPADFTAQPDYYENNLNLLLAAGDGGVNASHTNVREYPQYHIYLCLPDNSYEGTWSGDGNVLTSNIAALHALNATSEKKHIICYCNMFDERQLNNFVNLFTGKFNVIDTMDGRFNFNEQTIPELLLRPGGIIIRDHMTADRIAEIKRANPMVAAMSRVNQKREFSSPFICIAGDHPLDRAPPPGRENYQYCQKIEGLNGGKRRRHKRVPTKRNKRRRNRKTRRNY
jgi:hypothetical protein